jgi:hypothetical protein
MATEIHRLLKVLAFNVNDIGSRRYELSKELQELNVDVALFSETHLKPHDSFFQISTFAEPIATRAEKAELPFQLEKAFPTIV